MSYFHVFLLPFQVFDPYKKDKDLQKCDLIEGAHDDLKIHDDQVRQ